MNQKPVVILVGPPGVGKSTVAYEVARQRNLQVRDTDTDIEKNAGKSISDIFVVDGEPHFRALERAAVATAISEHDGILALGGGAVVDEQTQRVLADYAAQGGHVVFLDVSLAHAAGRVGLNRARPLLLGNTRAQWRNLMNERRPIYESVATMTINTDDLSPQQVSDVIIGALDTLAAKDSNS